MGLWTRAKDGQDVNDLVHHSDRGMQYVAVRQTQRLAEAGAVASAGRQRHGGSVRQLIRNKGPGAASTTSRSPSPSTLTGTTAEGFTAS